LINSALFYPILCTGQLCLDSGSDPLTVPTELEAVNDPISSESVISFTGGMYSSYLLIDDGSVIACDLNDGGKM